VQSNAKQGCRRGCQAAPSKRVYPQSSLSAARPEVSTFTHALARSGDAPVGPIAAQPPLHIHTHIRRRNTCMPSPAARRAAAGTRGKRQCHTQRDRTRRTTESRRTLGRRSHAPAAWHRRWAVTS